MTESPVRAEGLVLPPPVNTRRVHEHATRGDGCCHRHVWSVRRHGCRGATADVRPGDHLAVRLGQLGRDDPPPGGRHRAAAQRHAAGARGRPVPGGDPGQLRLPDAGVRFPIQGNRASRRSLAQRHAAQRPQLAVQLLDGGKQTGVANPVTAEVVYASTGATAADFPADSAGKIILLDYGANAAARNTQVANAIAAGAVGMMLGKTTTRGGTPPRRRRSRIDPPQTTIPVIGAGRATSTG